MVCTLMGKIGGVSSPLTMQNFGAWSNPRGIQGDPSDIVLTAQSSPTFARVFKTEEEARDWATHNHLTIA